MSSALVLHRRSGSSREKLEDERGVAEVMSLSMAA